MVKEKAKSEDKAWQEYLKVIEPAPAKKKKKENSLAKALREALERIRHRGKGREKKALQKQVAISAKEGRKIFEKEKPAMPKKGGPVEKKFDQTLKALAKEIGAKPGDKSKALKIEKYFAKVEEQKKGFKRRSASEVWKRSGKKEKGKKAAAKEGGKWTEKKWAEAKTKLAISKKVAFLPSALKGVGKSVREAGKKAVPVGKKGKAKPAGKAKKSRKIKLAKLKPAELKRLLGEKPSIARKSIAELKKLSTQEIRTALKKERIKRKARGWFGDALKHRRAALKGWEIRKRLSLHKLKKRARKRKLSARDKARKKQLHSEAREYKVKLADVEKQIRSLKRIGAKKKKETKALAKKIKKAGVKIPKAEIEGKPKGRSRIKDMRDVAEIAEAMKSVADEVAAATLGRKDQSLSEAQTLSIEDQIKSQERLIRDLELAFYKRRIGFNQFREKMFEYQSKLSQLRIQKKLLEKKMLKPEPVKIDEVKVKITPKAVRKLNEIVDRGPGFSDYLGKKTSQLMEKLGEQKLRPREEKARLAEDRKAAEKAREEEKRAAVEEKARATEEKKAAVEEKARERKEAAEAKKEEKARAKREAAEARKAIREERAVAKREAAEAKKDRAVAEKAAREAKPKVVERIIDRRPTEIRGFKKLPEKFVEDIKKKVFEREGKEPLGKKSEKAEEKKLSQAVMQKGMEGHLSKDSIDKVEKKLESLMKKYHIPADAISNRINSLNSDKLVQDFQKLINLIEEKKGRSTSELLKPFDVSISLTSKKREKIIGKEKEIKKIKIETTFDRVLNLVQVKGSVKISDVAKELGMKKKEVQECAEILESSQLIKLIYPAIGSVRLVYPGYLKWKEEQKKQKRMAKRRRK
jgi:hypothetical protein